jgi:polyphosphate kinase
MMPEATEQRGQQTPATATAPPSSPADAAARRPEIPYLNRELQWLEFNDRVLAQVLDERIPLLERVRFLAIHANNLDEFFTKRVGGLRRLLDAGVGATSHESTPPQEQLAMLRARLLKVTQREADIFRNNVLPALKEAGINLLEYSELTRGEVRTANDWYRKNAFPTLTPLAVDPGHRFPFISNLSVSLGILLRRPGDPEHLFARVKVPQVLPQWVPVAARRFVPLREIIEHNLSDLFPGMDILKVLAFRVTRNADIAEDNEDADDLLESIQEQLRQRRFAPVVRLQIGRKPNRRIMELLSNELDISVDDIYETPGLVEYTSLREIANLDVKELRYAPWRPVIPRALADADQDIFSAIRQGDILVHHPYESFDASVERFIEEASADPNVLGIKQALYRTSGDSPFVRELIRAAESGKQVAVLVEVRARFDEASNIVWARRLEEAGVHVAHGVVGLKTHTKIALVVRREADGLRSYAHLSTGNYNSQTAQIYEDFGLFTCDPVICDDVMDLFNAITGRSRLPEYSKLIVAPSGMRSKFLELINQETANQMQGRPSGIIAKMNQLQDQDLIDALYKASQAGVKIDLIVRGFCTLRPGVPGLSDNISVYSIIGRFLEHSRIFYFRNGAADAADGLVYIGSADWMYRNLSARVEAACPIENASLRARLRDYLNVCLSDRRQSWEMRSDGTYAPRPALPDSAAEPLGTHQVMMNAALQRSSMTDLTETD